MGGKLSWKFKTVETTRAEFVNNYNIISKHRPSRQLRRILRRMTIAQDMLNTFTTLNSAISPLGRSKSVFMRLGSD